MKHSVFPSILLLCIAVACGLDTPVTGLEPAPLDAAKICSHRDSVLAQMTGTTIDDYFEVIARLLPGGFGGLTASKMWLKQPEQENEFRRTAAVLEECSGGPFPFLMSAHYAPVEQGTYDWIELRAWYRLLRSLTPLTANSTDMDEGMNRLSFTFTTEAALEAFRARAVGAGVPVGALSLRVQEPPVNLFKMM